MIEILDLQRILHVSVFSQKKVLLHKMLVVSTRLLLTLQLYASVSWRCLSYHAWHVGR